ncbi:hypothetical protein ACIA6C_27860 [Streptomyces sp. NPDC051578]|uniref:hypothetical protein n=1 Tax=Streptomyces sp. NPDC051578 TaxID=3365662 RepID=UPI0037BAFD7E
MSAGDTALACIGVAIGLACLAPAVFDAWHKPRTHRRFQRSAQQAARAPRTEAEVRADLAAARALVEQHVTDIKFARIIADQFPAGIPHQTRRTEEDQ